jgi:hypothetical protein
MPALAAPDYQLARAAIERGLGLLYLVAFVVALRQFPALCGERGLEPAPRILAATTFWEAPSVFHLGYSDGRLRLAACVGRSRPRRSSSACRSGRLCPSRCSPGSSSGRSTCRSSTSGARSASVVGGNYAWLNWATIVALAPKTSPNPEGSDPP